MAINSRLCIKMNSLSKRDLLNVMEVLVSRGSLCSNENLCLILCYHSARIWLSVENTDWITKLMHVTNLSILIGYRAHE